MKGGNFFPLIFFKLTRMEMEEGGRRNATFHFECGRRLVGRGPSAAAAPSGFVLEWLEGWEGLGEGGREIGHNAKKGLLRRWKWSLAGE